MLTLLLPALVLNGCSDGNGGIENSSVFEDATDAAASTECSSVDLNRWVYNAARDYYFYADRIPELDPDGYESPWHLLAELRAEPEDPYSHITQTSSYDDFYEGEETFGMGFNGSADQTGMQVLFVYRGSVFAANDVRRGDYILSANGLPWTDQATLNVAEMYGSADSPLQVEFEFWRPSDNTRRRLLLQASNYPRSSVLHHERFSYQRNARATDAAYIAISSFVESTTDELLAAFGTLGNVGVEDVIVDLRYNRGGRISAARLLSSLIGGDAVAGREQLTYVYNDRYSYLNQPLSFDEFPVSTNPQRVVILSTELTASAAELVINVLKPWLDVTVIGTRTEGKAFFSRANDYCGLTLNLMEGISVNALQQDVIGGIAPDCGADFSRVRPWGVPDAGLAAREQMDGGLAAALNFLENGRCDASLETAMSPLLKSALKPHTERYSEGPVAVPATLLDRADAPARFQF